MKRTILLLLILSIVSSAYSQEKTGASSKPQSVRKAPTNIKKLFEEEQYYDILSLYALRDKNKLTPQELIYIGWTYYMFGKMEQAEEYNNLAIKKEDKNATAYYIKGLINISKANIEETLIALQKAIDIDDSVGSYYTEIGNIYLAKNDFEQAIEYYQKAISATKPSENAYYMLADTYDKMGDHKLALEAFREARTHIKRNKELYSTVLYNIGTIEMGNKNYKKAIYAFNELLGYFPDDYLTYSRIVQCCYALEDYKIGDTYKDKLYTAYQDGSLIDSEFADKFCVDNFEIDSKTASCYEYFQSTTNEDAHNVPIYIFYVINTNGMIEAEIQYNYIAESFLDKTKKEASYQLIVRRTDKKESSYIEFAEDQEYSQLKAILKNAIANGYKMKAAKFIFK